MGVGFPRRIVRAMDMVVMIIVGVAVLMHDRRVLVLVFVAFGQVEPQTDGHQQPGKGDLPSERLTQHREGH